MSIRSIARARICKRPVFNYGAATFARKKSCIVFRWRPRLYLQLPWSRKPDPSFDLEWWHWAGSTCRISSLTTNIIIFDRKWKLKLGLLATPPLERGSPQGI